MNAYTLASTVDTVYQGPFFGAQKPAAVTNSGQQQPRAAAIERVYETYLEQIYKYIFFKVGNREDAEDITSQVFIKAANFLDVEQDERAQVAWLYQVARTTVSDHWRAYYKGPTSSIEQMEEANPLHLAAAPLFLGGSGEESASPSAERAAEVLAALPQNYRRVLELRFIEGCSLKETAAAMQITEANVKVMQHRALQKAVKLFGCEEDGQAA